MSDEPQSPDFPDELPDETEWFGRFDLDSEGEFSADVFRNNEFEDDGGFKWELGAFFDAIGFDAHSQVDLLDALTVPLYDSSNTERIDIGGENVRGGYDKDEVVDFLNHTGFWGLGIVYYDYEFDEYFVDLEDVSG